VEHLLLLAYLASAGLIAVALYLVVAHALEGGDARLLAPVGVLLLLIRCGPRAASLGVDASVLLALKDTGGCTRRWPLITHPPSLMMIIVHALPADAIGTATRMRRAAVI